MKGEEKQLLVGSIGYATEQGLGYLCKWYYDNGIVDQFVIYRHPKYPSHLDWYPTGTPVVQGRNLVAHSDARRLIGSVDVMLFFETPFDWNLLRFCRQAKKRTVLIPMYEWTPQNPPNWFDAIISPSLLDKKYFPESLFIPIPSSPWIQWKERTRSIRYLHNAGHVGHRNHKGTMELLHAVKFLKSPLELTIRCQHPEMIAGFREIVGGDNRVRFESAVPYNLLFTEHDVYVAPEKFNGCSIPLQEAHASGMLVITTNRFPMNTWLPTEPMIPVESKRVARIGNNLQFEECLMNPETIAHVMDSWYNKDITYFSQLGKQWSVENSWKVLGPQIRRAVLGIE